MKKTIAILLMLTVLFVATACGGEEWIEYDYNDPEAKFKAEQMIKIEDDDKFEDYFECKVWATKRTLGIVLPTTKQEYFEGWIARPDQFDNIYIFIYDLKGDYANGEYSDCRIVDFNDTAYDEFKDAPYYVGHYRIDRIKIKKR